FQILTVVSRPAEASCLPSGRNATANTGAAWPSRRRTSLPVARSQTLISPILFGSELAEATCLPSGPNATPKTQSRCPWKVNGPRPPQIVPLPAAQMQRTVIEQLLEATHVIAGQLAVGK